MDRGQLAVWALPVLGSETLVGAPPMAVAASSHGFKMSHPGLRRPR